MKPVMFDIDGVLADFTVGFTRLASALFPEKQLPVVKAHQQPSYKWQGLDSKEVSKVWKVIDDLPGYWELLPPLAGPEVFSKISKLNCDGVVYFVTARPNYAKTGTEAWLLAQGVICPTVVMTKNKGEFAKAVGAGWSIEDKASNASMVSWLTQDETKSYLLDRPYNAAPAEFLASGVQRIYNVEQYLEAISGN